MNRTTLQPITLERIDKGLLMEAMQEALIKCADDIHDRSGLMSKRELTVKITLGLDKRFLGDPLQHTNVEYAVNVKLPAREGGLSCCVFDNGEMHINVMEPDNPDQMQIEDATGEKVTKFPAQKKV